MEPSPSRSYYALQQIFAAIRAQLQTLGDIMANLEHPRNTPQKRRQAARNIHYLQDARMDDHLPELDEDPPDPPYPASRRRDLNKMGRIREYELLRPNISFFGRRNNPKTYIAWELHMEELFYCYNYTNSRKVAVAASQLMGNVLTWWTREASERRRHNHTQIFSWEEMKQHLKQSCVPYSFQKNFPNYFDRLVPNYKAIKQRGLELQDKRIYVQEKSEQAFSCVKQDRTNGHISKTTYFSKQKVIIQAKEDNNISNQSTLQEVQAKQDLEDVQVAKTKVSLSKKDEKDSRIKENPIDATMNDKGDPTKVVNRLIQKLVQKRPSPSLTKETDLKVYIHANLKESQSMRERTDDSTFLIGLGREGEDYNINMEPHNKFKPNQNQGVLYPLLIKEAHQNSHNQILPKLIKPQGKLLKSLFHDTYWFSFHGGKTILRTKPCQEGGNDEDLKSKLKQQEYELKSNKEQDTSKTGTRGYRTRDPGERMRNDLRSSYTIFD